MGAEVPLNPDFREIVALLEAEGARYLIVGAYALGVLGTPRATGDLDLWVECSDENSERVWRAVCRFGAPVEALGVTREDFATPGMVIQLGTPPRRIDFLTRISGVEFASAWPSRLLVQAGDLTLPFLGRADFVRNKLASGRLKDLGDLESIGEPTDLPEQR